MKTETFIINFNSRKALNWLSPLFKISVPKSWRNKNYSMLSIRLSEKDTSVLVEDILFHSRIHKDHSFELIQIFERENNKMQHVYEVQDGRMTFKYLEAHPVIDMPESVITNDDLCDMALGAVHSLSKMDFKTRDEIFFYPWEASTTIEEDGIIITVIKNGNNYRVDEPKPLCQP